MAMDKLSLTNIYSYQEYQLFTVLEKLAPNENNLRPEKLEGLTSQPDFFLSKGLKELELEGPTAVETKSALSFSSLKSLESYFETLSMNGYNLLVVFFDKTLSKTPSS